MTSQLRRLDLRYATGLVIILHAVGLVALLTPARPLGAAAHPHQPGAHRHGAMLAFSGLDRRTVALGHPGTGHASATSWRCSAYAHGPRLR
jgi:hypothetical protein